MNTTCLIEEKSEGDIRHDLIMDCLCFSVVFLLSFGFHFALALSTHGRKTAIFVQCLTSIQCMVQGKEIIFVQTFPEEILKFNIIELS